MSSNSLTPSNMSPYMMARWPLAGHYDLIMNDWYCEIDAYNTYWATHSWSWGYAGFQNKDGNHVLLLSLWDRNGIIPEIEYISGKSDSSNLNFYGEGTGKRIFTSYNWKVNIWYTMAIGINVMCGKTYFSQWVREANNPYSEWFLAAVISLPVAKNELIIPVSFQEDFTGNKEVMRKCRIRNAYARHPDGNVWYSFNNAEIHNTYRPYSGTDEGLQTSVSFNCDWGSSGDRTYIWIQSGGNTPDNGKTLPATLTMTQPTTPSIVPALSDPLPRYLKNNHSGLYAYPSGASVIQSTNKYYWNIKDAGDNYFYVLTEDGTKALQISGTSSGANLTLAAFAEGNDAQKWTKSSQTSEGSLCSLIPKSAPALAMTIENAQTASGAAIEISTKSNTLAQFKWEFLSSVSLNKIKSNFSNLFAAPSGTNVIQSSREYVWNIAECVKGDYFYILSTDNTKAVTVDDIVDGEDLFLADFNPENIYQKWEKVSAENGMWYIRPKANVSHNFDIEGPSVEEGAPIQLWRHSTLASQFKWHIIPDE